MRVLNKKIENLASYAKEKSDLYQQAEPFPSIYLDDFFDTDFLNTVLEEFPDLSNLDSKEFNDFKQIKLQGKGEMFFEEKTKILMHYLNSEPFLEFLQIITGIQEPIIGDPYFIGGGQHEIKKGGLLKIHADFNKHSKLKLDRRINVLVYLNKDWDESYGGHFELWDRDMKEAKAKILPLFNRLAIFSTTDFSYHGHPNPLNCPDDRSRKSLALYYYSNGRPSEEINSNLSEHSTIFKERVGDKSDKLGLSKKIKSFTKKFIPPILLEIIKK
jgi:hypothetical protein